MPTTTFSYISGQAGTGKTFLAQSWAEQDEHATLCSTTGVAAINIGGTTINALLRYFDTQSMIDAYVPGWIATRLRKLRDEGTHWIILDEVSMFSAPQLTMLVRAIEDVNRTRGTYQPELRLTVIGDFAQLRPINEPFAFTSPCWPQIAQHTTTLTEIRRQSEREFVEALQAVRMGDATRALEYFGPRLCERPNLRYNGTTIKALNQDVTRYNELQMDAITGREVRFPSIREGIPRGEWKLIPHVGVFKIGALVMILANQRLGTSLEFEYVNGDLGELVDAAEGDQPCAFIKLYRTGHVVKVPAVTRKNLRSITSTRRTELKQSGNSNTLDGRYEVAGSVQYVPIRAAWATTVDKSQGLSFDAVQVDIRNRFFRTPGRLYVALSRARTASGLRVVGTEQHFRNACLVDAEVRPWL